MDQVITQRPCAIYGASVTVRLVVGLTEVFDHFWIRVAQKIKRIRIKIAWIECRLFARARKLCQFHVDPHFGKLVTSKADGAGVLYLRRHSM